MDTTMFLTGSLDALAVEINTEHEAALSAVRSGLHHAHRAGELLIEAKAALDHGAWLPWLAEHCPAVSERVAQMYMRVAQHWPALEAAANTKRVSHLPLREALTFLAKPGDLREQIAADEADWETVRNELDMLRRVLDLPDLSLSALVGIERRAKELETDAAVLRLRAERKLGRLINEVEERWGKKITRVMLADPTAFIQACDARIVELAKR
jgi:hypothetical protein